MSNVVYFNAWKRAQRMGSSGGRETIDVFRRARPSRRGSGDGFVRIGDVSSEIVRKLTE